jgi:hypothetical protein
MKIDTTQIPEETGKRFGQCIVAGLREYLKQPGAREALDARTAARHERRKQSGYESLPSVAH